jgi:hypothetical protein
MKRFSIIALLIILASSPLLAHTINYSLDKSPLQNVIWYYMKLGFNHILPQGPDHILFIIGLCLLSTKLSTLLWQATAFTVAHTITLILSMKGILLIPSAIIEPVIALSIAFVAIENIVIKELTPWRIIIVFLFGLIHGMGFASSLNELGLPPNGFYTSLISFNAGVELCQILIISIIYFSLIRNFGEKEWYRKRTVFPLSACIALIALYWTITRI